ncbi:lipoyl synthase [bacterium]
MQKPTWLRKKIDLNALHEMKNLLREHNVNTVCEHASCPNIGECFKEKTATFMIMGNVCTRNCFFCNVKHANPKPLDNNEPKNIADVIKKLKLDYVVITSVTRDDLSDGGLNHFAKVVKEISGVKIEVLTSDFYTGDRYDNLLKFKLNMLIESNVSVFGHNVETVPRLYKYVRANSDYKRSLNFLKTVKDLNPNQITKSGFMLGLGEKEVEVIEVLKDLRKVCCDVVAIGQYLAPSTKHYSVQRFIAPDEFVKYQKLAKDLGFKAVESGPYVRSSYNAKHAFDACIKNI